MTEQNKLYLTYAALGMSAVALYMLWRETQKKNGAVQQQEQAENNLANAAEQFAGFKGKRRGRGRGLRGASVEWFMQNCVENADGEWCCTRPDGTEDCRPIGRWDVERNFSGARGEIRGNNIYGYV